MHWRDEWPSMADGTAYDGKDLLSLARAGHSPFEEQWNVLQLIREIEEHVGTNIVDIPLIAKGSNNFGMHMKTSDGRELVARLSRGDVNMPGFDGFPIESQVGEVRFEAAAYTLLRNEVGIRPSRLLYHRVPVQLSEPQSEAPQNTLGRRLFVFERSEGENVVWDGLSSDGKLRLLDELASMWTALFRFEVPNTFAEDYLHKRLFKFKPDSFSFPVAPTRDFWMHVLTTKVEATIRNVGDMIGWEDDGETVGPIAFAAKQSLLRAIPVIMPADNVSTQIYRFVIDHGDFGIHNASIAVDTHECPRVTSLFDWETGSIVPACLANPLVCVRPVDLTVDENGRPLVARVPKEATSDDVELYSGWAKYYIEKICRTTPEFQEAAQLGRDLRYLWFKLRDWRGGDSENFFGSLGSWAEQRIKEAS